MAKDSKNKTAYCGIYCPDCIHYNNKYSVFARKLEEELERIGFVQYAQIESPFGSQFEHYKAFGDVLSALSGTQCSNTCRVGGGCSGKPCKIMECCLSKNYEGCWDCDEMEECKKFDFLQPRCGKMPKNNIRNIKKHGIEHWLEFRNKFYIWQR